MFASFARIPGTTGTFGLIFWGGVLLALLIAVGVLAVIEQRMFKARGKGGSALFVRLCSLQHDLLAAVMYPLIHSSFVHRTR